MVIIEGTASLNIVKEQLDESLKLAESSLEQYLEEPDNDGRLRACIEQLVQVKGVLRLIELQGAALLVDEIIELVNQVLSHRVRDRDHALGTLSGALMVLNKFLEYVQLQQRSLPVLLVPVINELRSALKKPLLPESTFSDVVTQGDRPPSAIGGAGDHDTLTQSVRRLRHLYQVGMLGVFQGNNVITHAKMMNRALTRIEALSGNVPFSKLWWLARGMTEALADAQVTINNPRKSLLGMIDRQIKALETQGLELLSKEPPGAVMRECLHVIALAGTPGPVAGQIVAAYGFPSDRLTDERLRHQQDTMFGPGGSVMRAVVEALREELSFIKEQLDLGARGGHEEEDGYSRVAEALARIANTLQMLGQQDVADALKSKLGIIAAWDNQSVDGESDEFQAVADVLLYVENSVSMLLPRVSGSLGAANDELDEVRQRGISLSHLDEARKLVVGESRAGLSLAKRAITSYMESNWDGMHLANVPTTLKSVWGGLLFLHMDRAAEVLRSCEGFIANRLIRERDAAPNVHVMETLADAITSVDYYLESVEDNKPIGDSILNVAEESMQALGFPVKAA
jgi:hypothetical protein